MLLNKFLNFLFAPVDTAIEAGGLTVHQIDDLLADDKPLEGEEELEKVEEQDDNKEDLLEKDDKKTSKKDEKEEELELEDEPEINEDELDDTQDVPRKEILAKYPDLFKQFPQLEKAYYREKAYSEILPTIQDAKSAVEKSENYDKFETTILSGNLDAVLESVKSADQNAFAKIVDNYMPNLLKADQAAYNHVLGDILQRTIVTMVQTANKESNEDLKAAAIIAHKFLFGTENFNPVGKFNKKAPEDNEEQTKLNNEKTEFFQQKFDGALEDVTTRSMNTVKSTISNHIDPKNVMTDYVKRVAIRDAMEEVEQIIGKDTRFKVIVDKLWEKAFNSNFSKSSMDDIKRALENRARTILPSVISKHRNSALRGLGKRVTENKEEPTKKGPVSQGRPATGNNSSNKDTVPKGMKTLDFLNSD